MHDLDYSINSKDLNCLLKTSEESVTSNACNVRRMLKGYAFSLKKDHFLEEVRLAGPQFSEPNFVSIMR
jgi:hypothetical protein